MSSRRRNRKAAATDKGTAPTDKGTAPTDKGTAATDKGTAPTDKGTAATDKGTAATDKGPAPTDKEAAAIRHEKRRSWLFVALGAMLVMQVLLPADATTPSAGAGLPLAILWLVLLAAWCWIASGTRQFVIRWSAVDTLLLGLLALHSTAAIWATREAAARPAINVLWQWIAMGAAFFLIRQTVQGAKQQRALCAVMISLAAGLAAHAYYQVGVENPATRRHYEQDPERELRRALDLDVGSEVSPLARRQFEARLYSPEPYATFILANSLAAFLAPWLIVLAGIIWFGGFGDLGSPRWTRAAVRIGLLLFAVTLAGALSLTRSRSAYLATVVGLVGVGALGFSGGQRLRKMAVAVALGVIGCLVALVVYGLNLPNSLAVAARRSAVYRWEYWQATWQMIGDFPWLGCGPGNFADSYTAYKLPQAFEEVADPHNFLLEVAATAGIPAAILLMVALIWFLVGIARRPAPRDEGESSADHAGGDTEHDTKRGHLFLVGGAAAGVPLAMVVGRVYATLMDSLVSLAPACIIAIAAAAALSLLWRWIEVGKLPTSLIGIATIVLLLHLLASGGIGNPGVAISLWLLVAVGLNRTARSSDEHAVKKSIAILALVGVLLLAGVCQWTAYGPAVRSRTALSAAERSETRGETRQALDYLLKAATADPLAAEPPRRLAHRAHRVLVGQGTATNVIQRELARHDFQRRCNAWLKNVPRRSRAWRELGDMHLQQYRAAERIEDLSAATQAYLAAIERYPHSSMLQAHLAWAYHLAGDETRAAVAAGRALELDELNPHVEKQLGSRYQKLNDREAAGRNTRQWMEYLLN